MVNTLDGKYNTNIEKCKRSSPPVYTCETCRAIYLLGKEAETLREEKERH